MRASPPVLILALAVLLAPACSDDVASPQSSAVTEAPVASMVTITPLEALGRELYFDKDLSRNGNQSCADCHDPNWGFTGPNPGINDAGAVYPGSFRQRFGARKPPSAAYATVSPVLYFDAGEGLWLGGNFWDGRATGWELGFPAAEQALGPFLNPVEQALPDRSCVIYKIRESKYAELWYEVWKQDLEDLTFFPKKMKSECRKSSDEFDVSFSTDEEMILKMAYDRVGLAIDAFEGSAEVNAFSSRFDAYVAGDEEVFTEQEELGFELFTGEKALCSACHPAEGNGTPAVFTDFSFDNLGVPINPLNPVYESNPGFVDLGLGGFLETAGEANYEDEYGKHKVPTLRNVDKKPATPVTKAFGHNGYFKSLEQIVHFYNTRDVKDECPGPYTADEAIAADCWPPPEVAENVNTDELGELGLTPEEEAAIVAFMRTLDDE